jgi:hypothetical protein
MKIMQKNKRLLKLSCLALVCVLTDQNDGDENLKLIIKGRKKHTI